MLEILRNKYSAPLMVPDSQLSVSLTGSYLETNLLELLHRGVLNANEAEVTIKVCQS